MGWDSASGDTSCDEAISKSFPATIKVETVQVTPQESKPVVSDHPLDESDPASALTDDNDVTFKPPSSCNEEVTDSDGPWKESFNKAFKSTKKHICTFGGCSRTFTRPWRLAAHARTHNGERPFKCLVDGCDREYTNNAHLRRHNQRNHSTTLFKIKFRCPHPGCFMELADNTSLKRHVERKHGTGRFACTVCGLQFAKHRRLAEHMHQHEPTSAPRYKCDRCDAAFFEKSLFEKHRNKHRTYACTHPGCQFTSTVWSVLRRHKVVEHPATRFTCSECDRIFASKTNLRLHLESHKDPNERLVYTCKVDACGSCYYQRRNLTAHIRRCHGGGEQFACTYPNCNKTLSTRQKLTEHMATQHSVAKRSKTKRRSKLKMRYSNKGQPTRSMASALLGIVLPVKKEKKLVSFNCKMPVTFEAGPSGVAAVAGNEHRHSEDEPKPKLRDLQKLLGSESDSTSVTDEK